MHTDSRVDILSLPENLLSCLPESKFDSKAVSKAAQLEKKELKQVLPHLLIWIQDLNWPIAIETIPILLNAQTEIISEIQWVLEGEDDIWKLNCINCILMNLPADIVQPLFFLLKRIASNPTKTEKDIEVDIDA